MEAEVLATATAEAGTAMAETEEAAMTAAVVVAAMVRVERPGGR